MGVVLFSSLATVAGADAATIPERNKVVWMTGFGNLGNNLNPWHASPGLGVQLMYMPFGGYNTVEKEFIPAIANSVKFNDAGTEVTVEMNPDAKWSTGDKVTAEDAKFSIETAMKTERFAEMKTRITAVAVDGANVKLTMNATYKNSLNIEKWFTNDLYCVPKVAWEKILATNTSEVPENFPNNWFDAKFDETLKISSGPYVPYYRDSTGDTEVYEKVKGWWGDSKIYQDLPSIVDKVKGDAPAYIGTKPQLSNILKDAGIITGVIDIHSGAISGIKGLVADKNYRIRTYYNDSQTDFFLPGGGVIGVAFNYGHPTKGAILSDPKIHKAMAQAINYDLVNSYGNEGNWVRARMGIIDDRCPTLAKYYDPTVQTANAITYDPAAAKATLIAAGWVFDAAKNTSLNNPAKDTTAITLAADGANAAWSKGGDTLAFTIQSQTGWGDVNRATEVWCDNWRKLGIPVEHYHLAYDGTYQNTMLDRTAWELTMDCITPQMGNDIMTVLEGYQGDFAGTTFNKNLTGWKSDIYYQNFQKIRNSN